MKKLLFIAALAFLFVLPAKAQLGKAISKLQNKVESEILGENNKQPEPDCACSNALTVFKFTDKFKINYNESEICVNEDGRILLMSKEGTDPKYFISENGIISGPFDAENSRVKQFACFGNKMEVSNNEFVRKQGDKLLIIFNGKTYGPFAEIQSFAVTHSKKKFVAIAVKNSMTAGMDYKAIEEKMKNATQAEQMAMAMEMSQKMQQQMMQQSASGEGFDMSPKLVTNIEGIDWNPMFGMQISTNIKYDDICLVQYNKITDLNGKTILDLKENINTTGENLWIKGDNSRYAWFDYGVLQFSDGKKFEKVFSPGIMKEGKVEYIRYMYYSPGDDAIKMCKISF